MTLGEDVRRQRKTLNLTQVEVAELADVSERFVRSVEQDKPSVQLDKLVAVVDALGLELRATTRRRSM